MGLSALTYLEDKLTKKQKEDCYSILVNKGFLVYNYDSEQFEDASIILDEYFEFERLSLRYKSEDFVISSSTNRDYLIYSIDGNNEFSNIISDLSSDFSNVLTNTKFSYIDNEGDHPDKLKKSVEGSDISFLFKIVFFGESYIQKYGREFFENFPSKKIEFMNEKIVRIQLVDSIFDTISEETKSNVRKYLQNSGIENISFYDWKSHRID